MVFIKKIKSIIYVVFTLLFTFFGCAKNKKSNIPASVRKLKNLSVIPADARPTYTIQFNPVTTFHDTTNKTVITKFDDIAVDEQGRVYVTNYGTGQKAINIFSADGRMLTHLGREGRGPGEFENILKMKIQANKLYVYDNIMHRINVFEIYPPVFTHEIIVDPNNWNDIQTLKKSSLRQYFVRQDGRFLTGFTIASRQPKYYRYYLADSNLKVHPQLIFKRKYSYLPSGVGGMPIPHPVSILPITPSSLMAVSDDGHIYSSETDDFLIKEYASDGSYQRAVYYPYKQVSVNQNEIINHYKGKSAKQLNAVRNALRDTWPALSYMFLDDQNRLWVATFINDKNNYKWWVLDPSGKLLAKFKWPGKRINRDWSYRNIKFVKNGFLYAFQKDTVEEGANSYNIVKFRINMIKN